VLDLYEDGRRGLWTESRVDNSLIRWVSSNFTNYIRPSSKFAHCIHTPSFPASNMPSLHHHRKLLAELWVGKRCSPYVEAWSTRFGVAPASQMDMAQHNSSLSPTARLDNAATSYTAPPRICLWFEGFMDDVEAWARCMSSLTQLVCTPAMPLIAWIWCQC
jgi:hypothetical protein